MRAGIVVSSAAHLAILAWGIFSLPMPSPVDATDLEMIPVDFVEFDDITQMTQGLQTAALVEEVEEPPPPPPEPEPPPLPRPAPPPPPPPPEPPPAEPEPPPLPAPAPPPPPEPAPPPPAPSPEATIPPPPEEPQVAQPMTNVPTPRLRPERPEPAPAPEPEPEPETEEFDVDKLTAMLDEPASQPDPPPAPVERDPVAGTPTAPTGVTMTANELDALRSRLAQCWNPPIGFVDPAEVRVVLLLTFNADGSLAADPQLLEAPQGQFARQAPESAMRAVRRCAPYNLPAGKYDAWREVKVTFDPQDMGRI
jgi:hypothetical protein